MFAASTAREAGTPSGSGTAASAGTSNKVWWGWRANTCAADQAVRPGLDPPDRGVAVFHREWEASAHKGTTHPLVFARGNLSGRDQRLGAAADGAIKGTHPDRAFGERTKPFLADFRPAGSDIPKCFRCRIAARHAPSLGWTARPLPVISLHVSRYPTTDRLPDFAAGRRVFARRTVFAALVLSTVAALFALTGYALSAGGFGVADGVLLLLFGLTMPWAVIGFWNGIIGFFVMRFARDPVASVNPAAIHGRNDEPITVSTAITIFVRNEPPNRVIRNLDTMMRELEGAGVAGKFHLYVLSDTNLPEIAILEEKSFAGLAAEWRGRLPVTYRRREVNTGFKAGNFWDFCQRWGDNHDFAVTLDTDSFMTAAAIMRMVRIMQADPKLGILQGLGGGPADNQRVRAHLPIRHAARHAVLHHRQRVVAGGLRSVLGPQRGAAHRAVQDILRDPKTAGRGRAARPCAEPRPDRGGADASRRLRRAGAAGGKSRLGREPADAHRIHPPRSALAAGNAAIRLLPVPAGPEIRQPVPARLCDADVPWLAGVDRPARCRHAGDRFIAFDRGLHPRRRGLRPARRPGA